MQIEHKLPNIFYLIKWIYNRDTETRNDIVYVCYTPNLSAPQQQKPRTGNGDCAPLPSPFPHPRATAALPTPLAQRALRETVATSSYATARPPRGGGVPPDWRPGGAPAPGAPGRRPGAAWRSRPDGGRAGAGAIVWKSIAVASSVALISAPLLASIRRYLRAPPPSPRGR